MNMISKNSLMDNFIFSNYQQQQLHPFHLSCSSLSSSLPYNDFLNYDALHDSRNGEDWPLGLVLDVEAAALPTTADADSGGVFMGKLPEGTSEGKKGAKNGKKNGEKARKHRYAFQTRSQVDILDDDYRWRKYGQKAIKNNKFPRSYYRCTNMGCSVKKQVQRLTKDEGVVVTTYEGVHSHPIQKSTDDFEHILGQLHIYGNNADTTSF